MFHPSRLLKSMSLNRKKEAKQTRLLLIGAIAVTVIVVVLLGYVLIDRYVITPNKVIASVGEKPLRFENLNLWSNTPV